MSKQQDRKDSTGGEGNRAADRRYREAVRDTVEETSAEERARKARSIGPNDLKKAREAEKRGRSRAKS